MRHSGGFWSGLVLWLLAMALAGCGGSGRSLAPKDQAGLSPAQVKQASGVPEQDGQFSLVVTMQVAPGGGIELNFLETLKGDFNPDGRVDFADVNLLVASFGQNAGESEQATKVDIHGVEDGSVNFADVNLLVGNFGLEVASYLVWRVDQGGDAYQLVGTADSPSLDENRRSFSFHDPDGQEQSFYALQPQDSSQNRGVSKGPFSACVQCQPPAVEMPPPLIQPQIDLPLNPGEVADVELAAGEARTISLDGGGGEARYLLVFYSLDEIPVDGPNYEQPDNAGKFQLTISAGPPGGGTASLSALGAGRPKPLRLFPLRAPELDQRFITCGFQGELGEKLRQMERINGELFRQELAQGRKKPLKRVSQAPPATRDFDIVFSDSDPSDLDKTVTADLVAQSSDGKVVFYQDRQHSETLPQNKLDEWVELVSDLIIPRESQLFGDLRDPDSSGRFTVLFTPEINRMVGSVQGLFVTNDQVQSAPGSNFMDIVYLAVPDPTNGPPYDPAFTMTLENWQEQVPSVIAHEMQHLLNYSNRLRRVETSGDPLVPEQTWLNEALSHFAEDIVGLRNRSLFSLTKFYLNLTPTQPLFSDVDSIVRRGGDYLLIRYLFDRLGIQAIQKLAGKDPQLPSLAGLENLERAWGGSAEQFLADAAVAERISGGPSADLFGSAYDTFHRVADDGSLYGDSGTGNFLGMEMRGVEEVNGQSFVVSPPVFLPVGDVPASYLVPVNALAFFILDDMGGSVVELSVDVGSDGQARELPVHLRIARLMNGGPEAISLVDQAALPGTLELRRPVVGEFSGGSTVHEFTLPIPNDNTLADLRWINLTPDLGDLEIELQGTLRTSVIPDNDFGIGINSALFVGAGDYNLKIKDPAAAGLVYLFEVDTY